MSTPDEAERERLQLEWFDKKLGKSDEVLLERLRLIAMGEAKQYQPGRYGDATAKFPTFSEQIAAAKELMDRHRGRTVSKTEVEVKTVAVGRWDPDALTEDDFQALKRIHAKAVVPDAVDADFRPDDIDFKKDK